MSQQHQDKEAAELAALLGRVIAVNTPLPEDAAQDSQCDAWAALQELQATIAGWASRKADSWRPNDDEFLATARGHFSRADVRDLIGDRLSDFDRALTLLYDRLR